MPVTVPTIEEFAELLNTVQGQSVQITALAAAIKQANETIAFQEAEIQKLILRVNALEGTQPPVEPPVEEPPVEPAPTLPMPEKPDTGAFFQVIDYTGGTYIHGVDATANTVLIRKNDQVIAGLQLRFKNGQGSNIDAVYAFPGDDRAIVVKVSALVLNPTSHGAPGTVEVYKRATTTPPVVTPPVEPTPDPEPQPEPEPEPEPEEPPVITPPTGPVDETYIKEYSLIYFEGNADWVNGLNARNTAEFLAPAYDPQMLTEGSTFKTATGRVLSIVSSTVTTAGRVRAMASDKLDPATEGYPNKIKLLTTTAKMTPVAYPDAFQPEVSAELYGLIGVNMGMLSNNPGVIPGTPKNHYWPWEEGLIKARAEAGCKIMRMPITANRLADSTGRIVPTVIEYMNYIQNALNLAQKYGIRVIVDAHTNFKYKGVVQSGEFWANFWSDFNASFGYLVWAIGIANEPYDMTNEAVFTRMQTVITRLRKDGYEGVIAVGGNRYSTAVDWETYGEHLFDLVDPLDNLIFEGHGYLNSSGIYDEDSKNVLVAPTAYVEKFQPMWERCKARGKKMYIGEFGMVKDNASTIIATIELMKWCVANGIPATYWADGYGWGAGDQLALYNSTTDYYKPEDNVEILLKYIEPFFKVRVNEYCPAIK